MSESLDLAAEIGLRVRNNRTLLKLSREKLAEEADISLSFLADIEHGRKNMTTVTLYGLCKATPPGAAIIKLTSHLGGTHEPNRRPQSI